MLVSPLFLASIASSVALAAPSNFDASTSSAAAPIFSWLSNSLTQWTASAKASQDVAAEYAASIIDQVNPFETPDYSDYSIWQVIQENEYLSDFKKVLKYAGPSTKELLDDKESKLTFLAPINWHHHKDHDEAALAQWDPIQQQIDELENEALWSDSNEDKDRKERKKKIIAYLIDKTVLYHVIDSCGEPLKAYPLAQNSSVATELTVGKAKKVVGNLWDGEQFRLRVGKSLLPAPALYFNFYSRVVKADVEVGNSIVHAVSFPILIPPSILQSLFFGQNEFSGLTSALQKVDADGYFKLPINESFIHRHDDHSKHRHHSFIGEHEHQHHHHHPSGVGGLTLFAPANLAFRGLPLKLRLFLFSPFGEKVLGYVLALHSLPKDIFFADFHHHVKSHSIGGKEAAARLSTINAAELYNSIGELASGNGSVTEYTFDTACPKLHFNKTADVWTESKMEFEQVDVKVYRYYLLPNGKGPLQTRISVNNVSVLFQDIPAANGALHQIEKFIMPKGHHHHEHSLVSHIAHQAEKAGFGQIDLSEMLN
jgi:uncharacterized surface protein with fasciclin (FAS1) repeats